MVAIRLYGLDRASEADHDFIMRKFREALRPTAPFGVTFTDLAFFFIAQIHPPEDIAEVAVFVDGLPESCRSGSAFGKTLKQALEKIVKDRFPGTVAGAFLN